MATADRSPDATVLLFQYGSNMHPGRFLERIEGACDEHAPAGTPVRLMLLGAARLHDWNLRTNLFSSRRRCRVLNIVPEAGGEVWGALYELPVELVVRRDGERSVLDVLEAHRATQHPENYAPVEVTVDLRGQPIAAWTYVGLTAAVERCEREHPGTTPSADYAQTVVAGALVVGVPGAHLRVVRNLLREE